MPKWSDFILNLGPSGPPTKEGIRALGFALTSDFPVELEFFIRVDETQSFTAPEKAQGRANIGAVIGTDVQAYSPSLASIAGLTTAANQIAYTTAPDTWAVTTLTAFARTLLDDASQAAMRTTLALTPGTDVQAYSAALLSIAGLTTAADQMIYTTAPNDYAVTTLTPFARTLLDDASQAAMRTTLGIGGLPTRQVFTTGSGTYTTPAGCKQITIRMIGGGGAGAGSGTSPGVVGSAAASTFGALSASLGGGANAASGGTTAAPTGGNVNIAGADGGNGSGVTNTAGGMGGSSPFGGGGASGPAGAGAGKAAKANSGAGGGGAGCAATVNSGGGGGAGGYIEATIVTPAASYSYAVGAGGTGGTAGTGGAAGGNGGSGIIIVDEYY